MWAQAFDEAPDELRRTVRRKGLTGSRNQCTGCGQFFNSENTFNQHRTGSYSARRCKTVPELLEMGFARNDAFFWYEPMTEEEKQKLAASFKN